MSQALEQVWDPGARCLKVQVAMTHLQTNKVECTLTPATNMKVGVGFHLRATLRSTAECLKLREERSPSCLVDMRTAEWAQGVAKKCLLMTESKKLQSQLSLLSQLAFSFLAKVQLVPHQSALKPSRPEGKCVLVPLSFSGAKSGGPATCLPQ